MFPNLSCLCRLAALRVLEIGLVSSGTSVLVCKSFCRIVYMPRRFCGGLCVYVRQRLVFLLSACFFVRFVLVKGIVCFCVVV